ncbi:MAG: helix-turn-helix domain-containing protein [Cyanothece sp. SIO2G6]|nr:helix-turn-helix domain-containing protein [Cyanothece sp. SIO2G6]
MSRSESEEGSTDVGLSPTGPLESVVVWNGGVEVDPVVQLRLSILRQLAGDGLGRSPTPAEYESAAVELGLSVSSVYRLLALYRAEGVSALGRRERWPNATPAEYRMWGSGSGVGSGRSLLLRRIDWEIEGVVG